MSRSMTLTESRYVQIEKEALALTWACERYSDYLIGLQFNIETDHKPLVPLFSSKLLDELPIRVQRFRMRMMRFNFSICHIPGKNLTTHYQEYCAQVRQRTIAYCRWICSIKDTNPATENRLEEIKRRQDEVCKHYKVLSERVAQH